MIFRCYGIIVRENDYPLKESNETSSNDKLNERYETSSNVCTLHDSESLWADFFINIFPGSTEPQRRSTASPTGSLIKTLIKHLTRLLITFLIIEITWHSGIRMHSSSCILICLAIIHHLSLVSGQPMDETEKRALFDSFVKKFNKNYRDENELNFRFQVFKVREAFGLCHELWSWFIGEPNSCFNLHSMF